MKLQPPEKRFEQALLELSRTQSIGTVFDDFLDFALQFIRWWDRKQENFTILEGKYPGEHNAHLFAEAYLAMADIADHTGAGFKDPFGDFYMEHLSNARSGQFFTPEHVCDMMAQMQMGTDVPDEATVADPTCGSGRLLLAAAKINRKATFYAADIDLTCCKMTVLNFLMNTMVGEVAWMDTLRMVHWKSWKIKKVMAENGAYLPYYIEVGTEQAGSPAMWANIIHKTESDAAANSKKPPPNKLRQKATSQLFLDFD